jgi:hypothetical protein
MVGVTAMCDVAALAYWRRPVARRFWAAGAGALLIGAFGSVPAIVSGLIMTRGDMLGAASLRAHHLAVWPAFALLIAATTWRALTRDDISRRAFAAQVCAVWLLAGCVAIAGYTGGELLQGFP